MENFNKEHPELETGECFLMNITSGTDALSSEEFLDQNKINFYFKKIDLKTKRLGVVAYRNDGTILKGCHPVFVQREELNERKG